jgi:hypothetical protein
MDASVWDVTVFTKNRDRPLQGDIAQALFQTVLRDLQVKPLLSDEHFWVDGTLIEAWATIKSFRPKDAAMGWWWRRRRRWPPERRSATRPRR